MDADDQHQPARRWPRRVAAGSATTLGLAVAVTAAGGWHYADELLDAAPEPPEFPIDVLNLTATTVTLAGDGADEPGLLGLQQPDGSYARVGPVMRRASAVVVRELLPGADRPTRGKPARLEGYAWPTDPAEFSKAAGLDAEDVSYDGPLGRYPATFVPAAPGTASRRWAIHVHGRGATRGEGYRLARAVRELGLAQLFIGYRNDDGAPADPAGRYGLGWTEADDVAAALVYARTRGAADVVLAGYSMGGAIVGNYLRTRGSAGVAGVVYDSPALSWPDILAHHARDRGLPAAGATVAAAAVRLRARISLRTLDQVRHADDLDVPVFLAHGAADSTVPVTSSDAFAEARPDLVTYLRTDAEHVRSWNVGPQRYEAAVATFLSRLR